MKFAIPTGTVAETPLFRSRFGGCWTDRRDARAELDRRHARADVTDAEAEALAHYIDHGYVVFPRAVDHALIDDYLAFFERAFEDPPAGIFAHTDGKVLPLSRELRARVAKVSDLHSYFERAGEIIFPSVVARFLALVYDRPPVVFQTMSMRKGSQEPLHIDTGPLTLTEPMTLAASWLALEDVAPRSGELEFVPGSHRLPEVLNNGLTKAHNGDFLAYGKVLARTRELCAEHHLATERFMAKKGDVLIWHADLMHGGAPIADPSLTRWSLVAHFMPLGVMPTFYDFSSVNAVRFPERGYCLDRLLHPAKVKPEVGQPTQNGHSRLQRLKELVPPSLRALLDKLPI